MSNHEADAVADLELRISGGARRRRVRAVVVSSALLLGLGSGLAACGDDDDDASDTVTGQIADSSAPADEPSTTRASSTSSSCLHLVGPVDDRTAVDDDGGGGRRHRDVGACRRHRPSRRTAAAADDTTTTPVLRTPRSQPPRDDDRRHRRRRTGSTRTSRQRAGRNRHRVVGTDDIGRPDNDRPGMHVHRQRGVPARPLRRRTADRRPPIGAASAGVRDRHRRLPLRRPDPLRRARLPDRPGAHRQRRGRRGHVGGPRRVVPARLGHRHQRQRDDRAQRDHPGLRPDRRSVRRGRER